MRLFEFSAQDCAPQFQADDYVMIRNCVTPEFLAYARAAAERCAQQQNVSRSKRALKREYIFDFPDDAIVLELVATIGALTGLPADELLISERHVKIYRDDAPKNPPPHKDRRGTQLSVGMPIDVPEQSRLILYPYHDRGENMFDSFDDFLASLSEAERPENALRDVTPVVLDTRPGDLIVFCGSTIWHERLDAAGSRMLYMKMNALGLDPLGENLSFLPLAEKGVRGAREQEAAAVL